MRKVFGLFPALVIGMVACLVGCNLPVSNLAAAQPGLTASASPTPAPTASVTSSPTPAAPPERGRLANPSFEGKRITATLFFAGQARDGSTWYTCPAGSNLSLYTVHPADSRQLNWSESTANRDFALDQMLAAGLNVISMSTWGEDFLGCNSGWVPFAPMQTAPRAQDELFTAAAGRHLLIIPFIESRGDWTFRNEFPTAPDGRPAPGMLSRINNLIKQYLKNPDHPEWAASWAQVYDRNLEPRYAVTIIHAASNRLAPGDDVAFAAGFDQLAEQVYQRSGIKIGFFIDPLPPSSNAPGKFKPSFTSTGPLLAKTDAILGIQAFIPEIWVSGSPSEAQLAAWKWNFSRGWSKTGLPFLMDVSPGYDAHIVFPGSIRYGFSTYWQDQLTSMVTEMGQEGLVYNSWNGYTEGMAAVPTSEYGDRFYRWLQSLCKTPVGEK
jgi:hypothetical protein